MTKRKSRRKVAKWIGKAIKRPEYKDNHRLHEYEEELVLRVMCERDGRGCPKEWVRVEPDRWRGKMLSMTFQRLEKRGAVVHLNANVWRTNWRVQWSTSYVLPEVWDQERRAREKSKVNA